MFAPGFCRFDGTNLIDWVRQEFGGPGIDRTDRRWDPQGSVAFWLDF
jgi:hypothetical protein